MTLVSGQRKDWDGMDLFIYLPTPPHPPMLRATRSAPGEKSASSSMHASTSARSRPSSINAGRRISSVTLARVERQQSSCRGRQRNVCEQGHRPSVPNHPSIHPSVTTTDRQQSNEHAPPPSCAPSDTGGSPLAWRAPAGSPPPGTARSSRAAAAGARRPPP